MSAARDAESGTARQTGVEIAYETFGDKGSPPLLLIAGLGDQMLGWPAAFCRQLVDRGFRVIRFDNRDVGLSTTFQQAGVPRLLPLIWDALRGAPVPAPYSLQDMAQDAIGVLDALGIESAHVLGGSLGGMIAQIMAVTHPSRVRTLTLLMTSMTQPTYAVPRPRTLILFQSPQPGRDAYVTHIVEVMRAVRGTGFPLDEIALQQRAGEAYDRAHGSRGASRQTAAIVASLRDLRRGASEIAVRTLVIHGGDDPLIRPAHGRRLARVIPGATLRIVEGLGHELPRGAWSTIIGAVSELAAGR